MKVWVLNHYAGLPENVPVTRTYDMAKRLASRGHQVTVFASSFSYYRHVELHLQPGEEWRSEEHDGVRFIWLKTYPYKGNDWRRLFNIAEYALRAYRVGVELGRDKPDIILGTCVHPLAPLAAWLLAKRYAVPFCYEVTDLWPRTLVDMGALSPHNPLAVVLYKLEKFLFRRAAKILSVLPFVGEYVEEIGEDRSKFVWIPNGIAASRCVVTDEPRHDDNFVVMYAGGFSKAQGLETIVAAAKIIQEKGCDKIRFELVGSGKEQENILALVEKEGIGNISFPGMVRKELLYQHLNKSDVLVACLQDLPLFRYGVNPNKLYDYLIVGKPVVYAIKSRNNLVADAQAGISIPPEDPAAMAEAILTLYNMDAADRRAMGERGRSYVLANHEFDILAGKLESLLKEVTNCPIK